MLLHFPPIQRRKHDNAFKDTKTEAVKRSRNVARFSSLGYISASFLGDTKINEKKMHHLGIITVIQLDILFLLGKLWCFCSFSVTG